MKERAHLPTEFLTFYGVSGMEGIFCIFTDDQEPQDGDLVVLESRGEKVFCTIEDPNALRAKEVKVLRVSRITYL